MKRPANFCKTGLLLVALACQQFLFDSPAQAGTPPNSVGCGVSVIPGTTVENAANGSTVTYTVDVTNPGNGCNIVGATVTFYCPGANGLPDLSNGIVLDNNLSLDQGATKHYDNITCTIN